jgi:hypothetical protein
LAGFGSPTASTRSASIGPSNIGAAVKLRLMPIWQFDCSGAASADRPEGVYSVEKLRGRILLKNAKALESLIFEGAEGSAISDDISSQSIVGRQGVRLSLVFSHHLIYLQNPWRAGNWFFNRIGRKSTFGHVDMSVTSLYASNQTSDDYFCLTSPKTSKIALLTASGWLN